MFSGLVLLILYLVGSSDGQEQGTTAPSSSKLTRSQKGKITQVVNHLKITIDGKRIVPDEKFFQGQGDIEDYLYGESLVKRVLVWEEKAKLNEMFARTYGEKIQRSATTDIEAVDGSIDDIVYDIEDLQTLSKFYTDNPEYLKLNGRTPKIRGAITKAYDPWEMPIKYKIRKRVSRKLVRDAIKVWQKATCIRFKERPRLKPIKGPNIVFKRRRKGCKSKVGQRPKRQLIQLSSSCSLGNVIHEIGHAIGFYHEHSRPDRKITVHEKNIKFGKKGNFRKLPWKKVETFDFPYDFESIMHYGIYAFSQERGKLKTITTHPSYYEKTIGQRYRLSFLDAKAANWQYCRKKCGNSLKWSKCKNGGYRNPNKCSECLCPDGRGGKFCNQLARSRPAPSSCGQTKRSAKKKHRTLTSPNYSNGGYTKNHECTWRIRSTPGDKVRLQFKGSFRLRCHTPCRDYVEVRYRGTRTPGPKYCCTKRPKRLFISRGRDMLIIFRTNSGKGRRGFKAVYNTFETKPRSNGT